MMRGCLKAVGCGTLLVAGLVVGWFAREDIADYARKFGAREEPVVEAAASPGRELARRAEEKVVALGQGEIEEATFDADELNSWIEHGLRGFFPEYISGVAATIEEDRLQLDGRVAVKGLPGIEGLGPWASLLGDTAKVTVRGRLDGLRPGAGVYYVDDVQVGALPLPDAMRDELLEQLRGGPAGDLPTNAVPFELPRFVTDVGVRGDEVFLRSAAGDER
jgi:hypothetical protein